MKRRDLFPMLGLLPVAALVPAPLLPAVGGKIMKVKITVNQNLNPSRVARVIASELARLNPKDGL